MYIIQFLLLLAVAYSGMALMLPLFIDFLDRADLRRMNFQGREVPLGMGLALVVGFPAAIALGLLAGVPALPIELCLIFVFGVTGFGLAGLIDDCLGSAGDKGFFGHFRALFKEGRLTSGALKALFGGTIALLTGLILAMLYPNDFGSWYQIVLNILLLASAANLINLFDLRPGRAGKVFLAVLVVAAGMARNIDLFWGPVLIVAVLFLPVLRRDLRGQAMLGDTGANFLGAVLGLAMVFWFTWWAKLAVVLLFLTLQALSERHSFSKIIEHVGFLRWLDDWGRRAKE